MRAALSNLSLLFVRRQSHMAAPFPGSSRVPVPKQIGQTSLSVFAVADCESEALSRLFTIRLCPVDMLADLLFVLRVELYHRKHRNRSDSFVLLHLPHDESG